MMATLTATWFLPHSIAHADIHSQVLDAKAKLAPVKAQLDKITKEYEQLVAQQNQTKEKIEKTQDKIDEVQQQIQTKQEELKQKKDLLAKRVSTAYKKGNHGFLQLLFASSTFAELSSNIYYLDKISEHDHDMIAEVNRTKSELTKTKAALELEKSALEKLEKQQAEELKKMQAKQEEPRKLYNSLSSELQELLRKEDEELRDAAEERARQLREQEAARRGQVSYTTVPVSGSVATGGGLTAAQKKVIRKSYAVASPGRGLCAMWVSRVFAASGYGYPGGNANDMYANFCTSSNKSKLKPGMIIAVPTHPHTRAGRIYGHVGIYVGNNTVRHNIGYICDWSLDSWIAYYGATATPRWGWCTGALA